MGSALLKRIETIEPLVQAQAGLLEKSVYGVVDKIKEDGTPNFIRKWKGTIGKMEPTDEEPTIYVIEKLEPMYMALKLQQLNAEIK